MTKFNIDSEPLNVANFMGMFDQWSTVSGILGINNETSITFSKSNPKDVVWFIVDLAKKKYKGILTFEVFQKDPKDGDEDKPSVRCNINFHPENINIKGTIAFTIFPNREIPEGLDLEEILNFCKSFFELEEKVAATTET